MSNDLNNPALWRFMILIIIYMFFPCSCSWCQTRIWARIFQHNALYWSVSVYPIISRIIRLVLKTSILLSWDTHCKILIRNRIRRGRNTRFRIRILPITKYLFFPVILNELQSFYNTYIGECSIKIWKSLMNLKKLRLPSHSGSVYGSGTCPDPDPTWPKYPDPRHCSSILMSIYRAKHTTQRILLSKWINS